MQFSVYTVALQLACACAIVFLNRSWISPGLSLHHHNVSTPTVTETSFVKLDSPQIPSMVMTKARFLKGLEGLYPDGFADVAAHAHTHIGKPLVDWVAGDPTIVIFHRGFTLAGPDGLLVEQSRTGIESVFQLGGRNIEIDTTPLRGARTVSLARMDILRAARNVGVFHDFYLHRQFGQPGASEDLNWEAASDLRISYQIFSEEGEPTDQRIYTKEAPINLEDYWDEIHFCYPRSNTIHDLREQSPLEIITQIIAIISAKVYPDAEGYITEGNLFHIYAFGFPAGGRDLAKLLRGILGDMGLEYDLKKIQVIPIISASMMHLVMRRETHGEEVFQKYQGCVDFLESFLEDFTVPAFNIGARMLDIYVNATTLELKMVSVQRDFKGQITDQVRTVFIDDHLLHQIKEDMYTKHNKPIMTTNKAAVTSWGGQVYQHWYRSKDLVLMNPDTRIEDFAFQQQSLVTTSINSGFHIILTDFPQEALAVLAFQKENKIIPEQLMQKFTRPLLSQEELRVVVRNSGKFALMQSRIP
ncbi:hypothetical protein BKA67DRAFT_656766 [Truncatella angustata]|uniref:Uncharacterized protein n=1 Tax=Truncatella angustata TaxID=152316 RepID=A0A9P8UUJ6_9PEZI|nr:uncharacterized protein BKA67DRAFT_656766 [Truncatella angustata]KAH6658586.1 hypothetical protein BKA67DRAFT_656766 [Truncatella angustata]